MGKKVLTTSVIAKFLGILSLIVSGLCLTGTMTYANDSVQNYKIVNSGGQTIEVTIEHKNADTGEAIYSPDIKQLTVGASINDYKKPVNWAVASVDVTPEGQTTTTLTSADDWQEIDLDTNAIITVKYTATDTTFTGETTFYDYNKSPYSGYASINANSNYTSDQPKLTMGTSANGALIDGKYINVYTSGTGDAAHKEDIIQNLTGDNYQTVNFNDAIAAPDFFSDDTTHTVGKTVYKNYALQFSQTGDTYDLTQVLDTSDDNRVVWDKANDTQSNGIWDGFYPLNDAPSSTQDNDRSSSKNYYFGMRYDVNFTLGDYVGDLTYHFNGDDDLWVCLDGEVIIDLGGIHDSLDDTINLWDALGIVQGAATTEQKAETHTLTVLYMERGAGKSHCQMDFTIPNAQIVDVTDLVSDKTVTLTDWDARIYDIDITAALLYTSIGDYDVVQSNLDTDITYYYGDDYKEMQYIEGTWYYQNAENEWESIAVSDETTIYQMPTDIDEREKATIVDTIDSRFELTAGETTLLENDGATVEVNDDDGTTTVTWTEQAIPYNSINADGSADQWEKTIKVVAKDTYIGGNDVPTNVPESSYIQIGSSKTLLPQPTVNVKADFTISNAENTIFWGDTADTMLTEDRLVAIKKIQSTTGTDYTNLDDVTFTFAWFSDEGCTIPVTLESEMPESDQVYYLQATMTPNSDGTASAENSLGNAVESQSQKGTYTVHVVKGQLKITKTIDQPYTTITQIKANQTFVFKVDYYGFTTNESGDYQKGALVNTFYVPINFDANSEVSTKSEIISGLKKGYYTVTEEGTWSDKYTQNTIIDNANNTTEGVDLFIGEKATAADWTTSPVTKPSFYGLEVLERTGEVTSKYQAYATSAVENAPAIITVTNNMKDGWQWLSDSALAINQFMQ